MMVLRTQCVPHAIYITTSILFPVSALKKGARPSESLVWPGLRRVALQCEHLVMVLHESELYFCLHELPCRPPIIGCKVHCC